MNVSLSDLNFEIDCTTLTADIIRGLFEAARIVTLSESRFMAMTLEAMLCSGLMLKATREPGWTNLDIRRDHVTEILSWYHASRDPRMLILVGKDQLVFLDAACVDTGEVGKDATAYAVW